MASNTGYNPQKWSDVEALKVNPMAFGVTQICSAGISTNIDYILTDDILIRGIEFLASGANFGDTVSIQVIDTNGITGYSPGTVISSPVVNWNVLSNEQKMISYQSIIPKKALTTFTIRLIYNSTGENPVNTAINYLFLKVLI